MSDVNKEIKYEVGELVWVMYKWKDNSIIPGLGIVLGESDLNKYHLDKNPDLLRVYSIVDMHIFERLHFTHLKKLT